MINSEDFIKRLEKIFQYYNLSATGFANKINVQRSSISHLLSGRNKPSLEFVLKVIKVFPEVNLYWLLNRDGSFPSAQETTTPKTKLSSSLKNVGVKKNTSDKTIDKVIIFYTDGSFKAYN